MIVTILRHGEAGVAAVDAERELTPTGIDDISFGSHRFRDVCQLRGLPAPELILRSAWLRTTETADILARSFPQAEVRADAALLPSGHTADVTQMLSQLEQSINPSHIVLVSHQPLVSELADFYIGFPHSAPPLPPGGLVTVAMDVPAQRCAKLLFWAVPPEYEAGL
ncbi:MAG: hypothetical protein V7746_26360 [Halioglobus sp.]